MPIGLETGVRDLGTKFLLFPQAPYIAGYGEPERVWVSPPAGSIGPGPADDRMYVVDVVDKTSPYEYPYMPPFDGDAHDPVAPDAEGHFDRLAPGSRHFAAAHLYGSVRRVLDIWESYYGRRIDWFFGEHYPRLELIPVVDWPNAQSGYGFMEFGLERDEAGRALLYALNFDVVAHEMGHLILFSSMGVPSPEQRSLQFYGFHEASADLATLVSMLHFDTVADRLLRATRGNLYTLNELNRIAELSDSRQIRLACNTRRMSDVTDEVHDLSRPFTGAMFDLLVDIYLDLLAERHLIDRSLVELSRRDFEGGLELDRIQAGFDAAYRDRHFTFKAVLAEARDALGERLAWLWQSLSADDLTYEEAASRLLVAETRIGDGRYSQAIADCFAWREVDIRA